LAASLGHVGTAIPPDPRLVTTRGTKRCQEPLLAARTRHP
jgi:hypothetical protein